MNITTRRNDCLVTLTIETGSAKIEEDYFHRAPEETVNELLSAVFELQKLNGVSDVATVYEIIETVLSDRETKELTALLNQQPA